MSVLPRRLFGLGTLSIVVAGLAACGSSDSESSTAETTTANPAAGNGTSSGRRTIVFEVTSTTASMADITMTTIDVNGSPVEETLSNRALPFSKTVDLDPAWEIDASMLGLTAQIKDGSDVTVSMTVDGGSTVTSSAEGENATAMVQGENA